MHTSFVQRFDTLSSCKDEGRGVGDGSLFQSKSHPLLRWKNGSWFYFDRQTPEFSSSSLCRYCPSLSNPPPSPIRVRVSREGSEAHLCLRVYFFDLPIFAHEELFLHPPEPGRA